MTSAIDKPGIKYKFAWMFGRNNDLLFYFAPILLALGLYAAVQNNIVRAGLLFLIVANGLGLNQFHLGPSWYFYFDKKNLEHWRSDKGRAMLFFGGPIIILTVCTLLGAVQPGILFLLTTLWGIQHFIQQNFGILILYHNPNSGEAIASRTLQSRSLWSASVFFSIFYFEKLVFKGGGIAIFAAVAAVLALVAIFYCALYLKDLMGQVKQGASLNVPALLFWFMGVVYFAPFALADYNETTAFIIPGVMHWSQYMFLNYMLVKYKYQGEESKQLPMAPMLLFFGLAVLVFVLSFSLQNVRLSGTFVNPIVGFLLGLSNVHYFQDAFLWRFREQFQRQSILPYLKQARMIESGTQ